MNLGQLITASIQINILHMEGFIHCYHLLLHVAPLSTFKNAATVAAENGIMTLNYCVNY